MGNNPSANANGRAAVITGGASGIGLAVAKKCLTLNMQVCITDISEKALIKAENQLLALAQSSRLDQPQILTVVADVRSETDWIGLRDLVYSKFGDVAFLFNNAGLGAGSSAFKSSISDWKLCMDVNLWGTIFGQYYFVPKMINQKLPSIVVNTSSLSGILNTSTSSGTPYTVAKNAVTLLTESLQNELRSDPESRHVTAHVLCPGWVKTNIVKNSAQISGNNIDSNETKLSNALLEQEGLTPGELAEGLFKGLENQLFYILVTPKSQPQGMIKGLFQVRANDIIRNRPPLSQDTDEFRKAWISFPSHKLQDIFQMF